MARHTFAGPSPLTFNSRKSRGELVLNYFEVGQSRRSCFANFIRTSIEEYAKEADQLAIGYTRYFFAEFHNV